MTLNRTKFKSGLDLVASLDALLRMDDMGIEVTAEVAEAMQLLKNLKIEDLEDALAALYFAERFRSKAADSLSLGEPVNPALLEEVGVNMRKAVEFIATYTGVDKVSTAMVH
ncbi:hypothetical protein P9A16_31655 [Shinella sp. 838]|uniref:hypothetical protein n=1 Tax=Shinella sp. 838 TaxID=3038164 RepID=UPI002414FFD5|nr:hypothetical protein [Shinella sp. 838]MDG4675658.1 hypothetical protein [Shinella sp. 838]